jgi:hypothetical protein
VSAPSSRLFADECLQWPGKDVEQLQL